MQPERVATAQQAAFGSEQRAIVASALGITQIPAWGSSYYLLAILAQPIQQDTGWPIAWIVGGHAQARISTGASSACPRLTAITCRTDKNVTTAGKKS